MLIFWEKGDINYVSFKGVVNMELQGHFVHENLSYNNHSATLNHEYEKVQLIEIHRTATLAVHFSTILFGILAVGFLTKCMMNRKCGGDKANATTKDSEQTEKPRGLTDGRKESSMVDMDEPRQESQEDRNQVKVKQKI